LLGAARRSHEPSCRITLRIYAFLMQASIGSNSAESSSSPVNGRRRALRGCARASARATGGFSRRAENELSSVGHRAGPPSTRISTNALTLRKPVDAEPTAESPESPDRQADPRHGPPTRSLRLDASVVSQRFVEDAPPGGGPGALLECSTLSATPRVTWRGLPAPSPEPCLTGR
jgi:hypothetical protein